MCRRRRGGCRMPDWLRDYEARTCSILAIISFSCAVTSFAVFTDSAVLSLTMPLKPAVCTVMSAEELYGLTKCHWTSCRGSCTALFYNCTQIKVVYVLSENRTSNVSDPDVFGTNDNVIVSNVTNMKYNEIVIPVDVENKTHQSTVLQDDNEYNVESHDESKNFTHNNPSEHLKINMTFSNKSENHLGLGRSIFKSLLPSKKDNLNETSKHFVVNSTNEIVPVSLGNESTGFESGHFNSEYIKEYEAADLVNSNPNNSESTSSVVPLYVNIFGCGYEPEELCEQFFANYTHVGMEFQCLIGHESEVFAVPDPEDYDFTKFKDPMRSLLLSLIPSGICVLSASYIRVRRLYKMKPKNVEEPEPKGRRRFMAKMYPAEEKESKTINLESRSSTKMSSHKTGQEQPAFIKVQGPPPVPSAEPSQNIDQEQFL